jgi:hypothetical protein
LDY